MQTQIAVRFTDQQGRSAEYQTRDISRSGMFVRSDHARDVGERLEIQLVLPDGSRQVTIGGEVVRQAGFGAEGPPGQMGLGIRFIVDQPATREEVERFIATLLQHTSTQDRRAPRIRAQLFVNLKVGGSIQGALMENISQGGMFMTVSGKFEVGDGPEVVLVRPGTSETFDIVARVVRLEEYMHPERKTLVRGIGVRFVEPGEHKRRALLAFLDRLLE